MLQQEDDASECSSRSMQFRMSHALILIAECHNYSEVRRFALSRNLVQESLLSQVSKLIVTD